MLSTNRSTSFRSTSRKYSAIVSADKATRRRTPGGSSICPNTSAVFSITPDSVISRNRSLPSRVRSPTPANSETPPCSFGLTADHLLDDHGLADAGAAEHPDLAALDVGLEQVDHLDPGLEHLLLRLELGERRRLAMDRPPLAGMDAGRIGIQRLADHVVDVAKYALTHGTRIGAPVFWTGVPRTRPSVGEARSRTVESPMCWATSHVIVVSSSSAGRP